MVVMKSHSNNYSYQNGGALIILVFILVLVISAVLISVLDGRGVKIERDKTNAIILADAKTALIGYAIGAVGGGQRPGDLIRPDTVSETIGDYDGTADASCLDSNKVNGLPMVTGGSGVNMRCLGRLPWKDLGMSIKGASESDSTGVMPWYAVSGNLVDPTCLKILNSNTLNLVNIPPPAPLDCTGITLPYPWLTVRDSSGNVISNRVAAVIFIPGGVRAVQARPISPNLASASQYLDTLVVPTGCAAPCVSGSYNNADMTNNFVFASEGMPNAVASDFNDQLVFISIDELMAAVEKRVAGEARRNLLTYNTTNGIYPDAATLGYQGQSCVKSLNSGFLPLPVCHCTGSTCDCAFPAVIKFTSDQNYSTSNGACSFSAKVCSCSGLGSCSRSSAPRRVLTCSDTGTCVSNVTGTFSFAPSAPIDVASMAVTSGLCTVTATTATCTGAGDVTVMGGGSNQCTLPNLNLSTFPSWFSENGWKHFIYYSKGALSIGVSNNASSLVITSGSRLASQTRPSTLIADYLDSVENTNGDTIFDAVGSPRSSTYNDQMFIVAP